MPRIKLISDVHVEFDQDLGRAFIEALNTDLFDVLVCAGDLGTGQAMWEQALRRLCTHVQPKPVLFVCGNHEPYESSIQKTAADLRRVEAEASNLKVLDKDVAEVGGQRFVGCTMWYQDCGDRDWSDFEYVDGLGRQLFSLNLEHKAFLRKNVQKDDIVVTHMLPSSAVVHPRWATSGTNHFFISEQATLISERQPKAWLFGHTHDRRDMMLGETRAVCQPRGCPWEAAHDEYRADDVLEL